MLEFIILGFLYDHQMTGYEIKRAMLYSTSNFVDASYGSIYPALKRLEAKKQITFAEEAEGGKYKKRYQICDQGRESFLKWLHEPVNFSPFRYEYLAKMFFYQYLSQEEVTLMIDSFIKSAEKEKKKLDQLDEAHGSHMDYYQRATLGFGRELYRFIMDWHENINQEIQSKRSVDQ
jgi:Predicted transcriptional regulators